MDIILGFISSVISGVISGYAVWWITEEQKKRAENQTSTSQSTTPRLTELRRNYNTVRMVDAAPRWGCVAHIRRAFKYLIMLFYVLLVLLYGGILALAVSSGSSNWDFGAFAALFWFGWMVVYCGRSIAYLWGHPNFPDVRKTFFAYMIGTVPMYIAFLSDVDYLQTNILIINIFALPTFFLAPIGSLLHPRSITY